VGDRLKRILGNNRTVAVNFSWLVALEFFVLLSPLVTYPYLIRTVGMELYGTVVFAQVIVTYVSLVVNFGFNLTGAKEIASNLANPDKISEIVSSVFINKFAIWLVCFFVYLLMISSFSFFSEHYALYFFSFFLTLNELLFPIWFYQGIEKMKYVTCVNVAIRLFFIGAIFIFVRQETDYIYVPVLNSAGAVLAGIASLYILLRVEKVKLIAVSKERLNFYFKEALPLFVSSLSIRIYQNANKIVVGSFLGMSEVAIFDLGEKLVSLIKIPVSLIAQAVFPKISRERSVGYLNKVMMLALGLSVFGYLAMALGASFIIHIFLDDTMQDSAWVIRILGLSAIFSSLNFFLGSNRLIPFGYKNLYMKIMLVNSMFYLCLALFMITFGIMNLYTISSLLVIVEIFNLVLLSFSCNRNKILFNK